MPLIHGDESPHLLFLRELEDVLAKEGLRISDDARVYLSYLLSDVREGAATDFARPVAPDLLKAMNEMSGESRELLLKGVGNTCLLLCGLWWQHVEYAQTYRRGADMTYHQDIGRRAYRMIDKTLYLELADNFVALVHVVALVGARLQLHDDRQVLRLYESFLRTQNEIAKKILLSQGIILENDSDTSH